MVSARGCEKHLTREMKHIVIVYLIKGNHDLLA